MKPSTAFVDPADNGNQVARGRAPDPITFIWTPARLSRGLPWLTVQTRYGSDLEFSLIGVIEVKLLLIARVGIAPVGHSLLFAVGAGRPHDGVRKARRPNLFHDLAGFRPQALDSQRDRLAHRPHRNDPIHPLRARSCRLRCSLLP